MDRSLGSPQDGRERCQLWEPHHGSDEVYDTACSTLQVARAMHHARRDGKSLQYVAARAVLWLLNDLFANLEALIFPEALLDKVCSKGQRILP